MGDIPPPAQVERWLESISDDVEWMFDEHSRAHHYRWAHSGMWSVGSSRLGNPRAPGHADPTGRSVDEGDGSRRGGRNLAVSRVRDAAAQIEAAKKALRKARFLLTLDDGEDPGPGGKGWITKGEHAALRALQAARHARGEGYGDA